jgi:ABC-type multidrug transport system fused ATPase/permease subunit
MNFKIESERKKFITKYDIDMDKYITDELVDELEENISNVFFFWLNIVLPILITCIISIIISVYFAYSYHSVVFGICLFVFTIPIFLFGAGSFGLVRAINTLCSCINYILDYTLNVITDIKKINNTNTRIKTWEICEFTLYGIVFPIVKKIIRNRLFGEILYFFIKRISTKGSKLLCDSYEKNERDILVEEVKINTSEKPFMKATKVINNISKKVLTNAILLVKIFGAFSILFGIILVTLLFFIH